MTMMTNNSEKVSRVLLMLADEQREMKNMGEGNIAVAVGMKNVRLFYIGVVKVMAIYFSDFYR